MSENINEQLNIADLKVGKNDEVRDSSRQRFEISSGNPELQQTADQLGDLYAKVAGDQKIDAENIQKIREQILLLQNRTKELSTAHRPEEVNENTRIYIGQLYPGIFANKNIEHIYTSYPEGKIEQAEMTVGNNNKEELLKEIIDRISSNNIDEAIRVSDRSKGLLNNSEFTIAEKAEQIKLVHLKVKDLGFTDKTPTKKLYERAEELGLKLCPPEVGPRLSLEYEQVFNHEQPIGMWLNIGMHQINDDDGSPLIFYIYRRSNVDERLLDCRWSVPDSELDPEEEFFFAR